MWLQLFPEQVKKAESFTQDVKQQILDLRGIFSCLLVWTLVSNIVSYTHEGLIGYIAWVAHMNLIYGLAMRCMNDTQTSYSLLVFHSQHVNACKSFNVTAKTFVIRVHYKSFFMMIHVIIVHYKNYSMMIQCWWLRYKSDGSTFLVNGVKSWLFYLCMYTSC